MRTQVRERENYQIHYFVVAKTHQREGEREW